MAAIKDKALETNSKLLEIQSRLAKFAYLSKESLPGSSDALVYMKIKNSEKMPTKDRYFHFYHWYITMSQFAEQEVERWVKEKEPSEEDKLITQSLALIESFKPPSSKGIDVGVDYYMNIIVKEPVQANINKMKRQLQALNAEEIGEELRISFTSNQDRGVDQPRNFNELSFTAKLRPTSCQKLKDLIAKWPQVNNIEIRKQKEKKL